MDRDIDRSRICQSYCMGTVSLPRDKGGRNACIPTAATRSHNLSTLDNLCPYHTNISVILRDNCVCDVFAGKSICPKHVRMHRMYVHTIPCTSKYYPKYYPKDCNTYMHLVSYGTLPVFIKCIAYYRATNDSTEKSPLSSS